MSSVIDPAQHALSRTVTRRAACAHDGKAALAGTAAPPERRP